MATTAQTPWRAAPLDRRAVSRMTAKLGERVLEQARGRQESAIDLVRKVMAKSVR